MNLNKDALKKKQVAYLIENWWRVRSKYKSNIKAFADFGERFGLHWRTIQDWYTENEIKMLCMPPKQPTTEPNGFKAR